MSPHKVLYAQCSSFTDGTAGLHKLQSLALKVYKLRDADFNIIFDSCRHLQHLTLPFVQSATGIALISFMCGRSRLLDALLWVLRSYETTSINFPAAPELGSGREGLCQHASSSGNLGR